MVSLSHKEVNLLLPSIKHVEIYRIFLRILTDSVYCYYYYLQENQINVGQLTRGFGQTWSYRKLTSKIFNVTFTNDQVSLEGEGIQMTKFVLRSMGQIKQKETAQSLFSCDMDLERVSRNQRKLLYYELYGIIVQVSERKVNELDLFPLSIVQGQLKYRQKSQAEI